jgi:hypothetical protein
MNKLLDDTRMKEIREHALNPHRFGPETANRDRADLLLHADALLGRITAVLDGVAMSKRVCKFCQRRLWLVKVKTKAGDSTIPFTEQGVNHFIDCPNFRKQADPRQRALLDVGTPAGLDALDPTR